MLFPLPLFILACTPPQPASLSRSGGDSGAVTTDSASDTGDGADSLGAAEGYDADTIFDPRTVHTFEIELDAAAFAALEADPYTYVQGAFVYRDRRYAPVGVRLKGNSSFEPITDKPAWKIKFNEYVDGGRFYGLERLTLNNNVWDATCMSENLGYRVFREAGSPAPRTGYANVTLGGESYGLYTVVEAADDVWVDHTWPGSEGGLWEMTRECDFTSDCSCFEEQWQGEDYDPQALREVCEAVATGDLETIREVFDWPATLAFWASERVANHPDSYTYNLNNYHIYHDPGPDELSFSPWGGDSMFTYWYPPDQVDHPCEPMSRYQTLGDTPYGYLGQWCESDPGCWAELSDAMLEVADLFEEMALADEVTATADTIREAVYADERTANWDPEHFEYRVDCFEEFIRQRPDEVRAFLGVSK